jgi:single-stranded-DNA-specific exonuclease
VQLAEFSSVLRSSSPELIAQLLLNRGVVDANQVDIFISADERLLNDPFLLPDMEKAVTRIYRALLSGEVIAVFGDFDVDGITATTLLVEGLSKLGARVIPYIPHRTEEGYGLNVAAIERLSHQGVTLMVTVDCGISAAPEVETAHGLGIDVVVTDHHSVPPQLPTADAVINAKRDGSAYPFPDLAGVGVAFKLIQALCSSLGKDDDMDVFLDLVALGTVADMVSLLGENRYLVRRGLEKLRSTKRLGLIELAKCAGIPLSGVDSDIISWYLAPRLNAAGRLDHAGIGLGLLSTRSIDEAQKLADILDRKNTERQKLTEDIIVRTRERLKEIGADAPLIMVGDKDFHSGVVGVAAGRLVEEYWRPAVVYEMGREWSRGSARSIPGFNMVAALGDCSDLLYRYGGHPMAAGFTVSTDNLNELNKRLVDIAAKQLSTEDFRRQIEVDAEIPLASLRGDTYKAMQQLAPFGVGNPYPTFLSKNVVVEDCRSVGSGEHLKLKIRGNGVVWSGISFKNGRKMGEVTPRLDIIYNLEVDQWAGGGTLQLNILDFAPVS